MFKQAILKTVHYILSEVIKGFKWKKKYKCKSQWSWKLWGITMLMKIFKLTKLCEL